MYGRTYSSCSFALEGFAARDWPFNLPAQAQRNYADVGPCLPNIRLQTTHMEGTGKIVYGYWSNDKSNKCSTHGSSCPAEVQVSVFTLFASLDIRKENRKSMIPWC